MKTDEQDIAQQRILHAAMEQFANHGFAETSIRQICEAANVNVAAVNYYFRSKEQLYHEVFRSLFNDFGQPLESIPEKIHDAASWRAALIEWISCLLRWLTNDQPPFIWISRLLAQERTRPSSVCPMLYESFFRRGHDTLERMLRLGLPENVDDITLMIWTNTITSQLLTYAHRSPPWDAMLIPHTISRDEWIDRLTNHIVEGIACRLSYRGVSP